MTLKTAQNIITTVGSTPDATYAFVDFTNNVGKLIDNGLGILNLTKMPQL